MYPSFPVLPYLLWPGRYKREVCHSEQIGVISMGRKEGNYKFVSFTSVPWEMMKKILREHFQTHEEQEGDHEST